MQVNQGFVIPLNEWFRGDLSSVAHDELLGEKRVLHRFADKGRIAKLLEEHSRRVQNRGSILWTLLMFTMWEKAYINHLGEL